jgi:hypothetical protein
MCLVSLLLTCLRPHIRIPGPDILTNKILLCRSQWPRGPMGPIHSKSNCAVYLCEKKNCTKSWTECSQAQHRFLIRSVSFFWSVLCLLVRVTMVDKNKAVVCCLLATSATMLSEKKTRKHKMWSYKWYLKRNITCDARLLNELLETGVPWNDAIMVSASKLRKVWDSLSELRSSLCERRLEDSSEACAIACQNCTVYSVFRQVWHHTVKSLSITESV